MESIHRRGDGGDHPQVERRNQLHIIVRDIANTDYTLEKLRELAPAALVGEQNFFIAYGLHKVA